MIDQKSSIKRTASSSGSRQRKSAWIICCFLFLATLLYAFFPIAIGILIPSRLETPAHLRNGLVLVETDIPPRPVADVIFVHGLGSYPDFTWHKPFPGERTRYPEGVHWIRDLLPVDIPAARLLMFNYDSTTYNNAPQKTLKTMGGELLFSLEHSRAHDTARQNDYPTIFVCHSYGGLVVKEALRIASVNAKENYRNPLQHTWGIIFLGVPHAGTENWWYTYIFARCLSSIGSNPSIFLHLAPESEYSAKLHEDFMKSYAHVKKVNFFETRKQVIFKFLGRFSPTRMIVNITSATFNGTNTENHSLDYDHSGLNKYNNVTDEGYVKIVSVLNHMMRGITTEEYKSVKRKAGADDPFSQIAEAMNSPRCNNQKCRNELIFALYYIFTDEVLLLRGIRALNEDRIEKMEDGWWKTVNLWLLYFGYVSEEYNRLQRKQYKENYKDWGYNQKRYL